MTNKLLINLSRILIAILIVFELLNQFKILNFHLTFTWFGLVITSGIAWILMEIASWLTNKICQRPIYGMAMIVAVTGLYMDALADMFFLFQRFNWYDQVAHFIGGAATAGVIYSVIKAFDDCGKIKVGYFGEAFFSWATANFFGAVYEIAEYTEDFFTGSHRLGDAFDTTNDMLLNLIGSFVILGIFVLYFYTKEKRMAKNRDIENIK